MYLIQMELYSWGESKVPVGCTCLTLSHYVQTLLFYYFIMTLHNNHSLNASFPLDLSVWCSVLIFVSVQSLHAQIKNNKIKVLALTLDE